MVRLVLVASLSAGAATAAPPLPKPAAPVAADAPSVSWNSADLTYELHGFPAVSKDGELLLFALSDSDAQGSTNLSIEWVNAHGGNAGDGVNMPTLDGPKRAPSADALAKVAAFLKEGQAKYHWAPLAWHAASIRDDGETSVAVDGFDIAMTAHDPSKLTLKKGGKLLASIDLVKDLSTGVQSTSRPKCGRLDAHLSRVVINAAHKFAVFAIGETSRDGCFQSDVYAIHSWK